MSGSKAYDKLLEKSTSSLLLEVDWESILRMCDLIRQGDVPAKYAITQLKKKMSTDNVNTMLFSLQCLESMVKNCGSKVHQEIATRDSMELLRGIAMAKSDPIKIKVLELIQCWAHAFRKNPNYKIVEDYFNSMKLEGFQYPALKESEAMFDVEEAPAWTDDAEASCCFRCRSEFSTLKRRHHCRACGQIFCNACSSKTSPIPKFGIEKEVRVCDLCFDKLNGNSSTNPAVSQASNGDQLPAEYVNSSLFKESIEASKQKPAVKSEQEFEDELQLALALSQSEAEAQESQKRRSSNGTKSSGSTSKSKNSTTTESTPKKSSIKSKSHSNSINNLASAPYLDSSKDLINEDPKQPQDQLVEGQILLTSQSDEEIKINNEIDAFVESTKKTLEIYINRMKSDSLRGRSITNDTAVQSLFLQLQSMHPKLLSYIKYQEDARGYYENLQDKLTQLKDAREALNALRLENFEKKKREMEERERQRQSQIAQKLHLMRQQKQNYYQYQNQLNLQHLQEKERELQMRMEQQRQLVMQRDQQFLGQPNGLQYQGLPTDYNQMLSNQVPYMQGLPPSYQQFTDHSNYQTSASPSKLQAAMVDLSLQPNINQQMNAGILPVDPNNQSQFHHQQIPNLSQSQMNAFNNQSYILKYQNGQIPQPNGQIPQPNGQIPQPNGQMGQQNGQMGQQNGQIPQPNGQMGQQNGQMGQQNGQMGQQNGQMGQQNGQMGQQNGQMGQQNGQMGQQNGQMGQQNGQMGQQNGQNPQLNYYQQPVNDNYQNPPHSQTDQTNIPLPMNEAQLISFD